METETTERRKRTRRTATERKCYVLVYMGRVTGRRFDLLRDAEVVNAQVYGGAARVGRRTFSPLTRVWGPVKYVRYPGT